VLKIKKTIGILLAACFLLSVTIASVSAAPDPKQGAPGYGPKNPPAQGYGQGTPSKDFKNPQFFGDMNKWNTEKKSWDNQKSKWDTERRKWDNEKRGWSHKKHNNDYMKWYRLFMQWLKQFNSWNGKYSNWYGNYNNHFNGGW
jgi:hypothetical protein